MKIRQLATLPFLVALFISPLAAESSDKSLRVGTFEVDASPPLGSPMAYDATAGVTTPLTSRGIVLLGAGDPIVLCAVDWIGIGNEAYDEFREKLAAAAGTKSGRVRVHALHQHDAPRCDFTAERILSEYGYGGKHFDERFCRTVFVRTAEAVKTAMATAQTVTHIGTGEGEVKQVASNRRILDSDGKVKVVRYTACRDPKVRAEPIGTIDPMLKMISFRNGEETLAALTFYATHPQSYYGTGLANPDFPGMARNTLQVQQDTPVIHFNGAGGNVGAGKWNDGSKPNRQILADKVLEGMKKAHQATIYHPVSSEGVRLSTARVQMPLGKHLVEDRLISMLKSGPKNRLTAAKHLAWLRRTQSGPGIDLGCLSIGPVRVLFMPGELFVEYQLAAQTMAPNQFVAMAAYGDYGAGYIGTEVAYSEGGYETSERATRSSSDVEAVLMNAMQKLLQD